MKLIGASTETNRAHLDLPGRFLARNIEHFAARIRNIGANLHQNRRLTHARLTGQKRNATQQNPATKHII